MGEKRDIKSIGQSQRDRLAYVELCLRFLGEVRRQDLVVRFGIQEAAATRDLATYRSQRPANIDYDPKAKTYVVGDRFKPLFDMPTERVLAWLAQGFGDGAPTDIHQSMIFDGPPRLSRPDLEILALVTRAIHQGKPLRIEYHSLSSGLTDRQIVPFALIDNGLRWHVRGFDRKSSEFRDFVITRIQSASRLRSAEVGDHERPDHDIQWTRIVEVVLVPHPDQPRPEISEMDYGMEQGSLKLQLRAATAGYTLRKWSVDCSPDHSLRGAEHRMWLSNSLALYGVKNAVLAPGYRVPDEHSGPRRDDR